MSNSYRFIFESQEWGDDDSSPFPSSTVIEASHEVDPTQPWQVILWQFCHFLESTGFEGVRERIKVKGPRQTDWLFETWDDEVIEFDDYTEALDNFDKDAQ